jgi:hypothetical protein
VTLKRGFFVLFHPIAAHELINDNGKPVEKQGRKARGLRSNDYDSPVAENKAY